MNEQKYRSSFATCHRLPIELVITGYADSAAVRPYRYGGTPPGIGMALKAGVSGRSPIGKTNGVIAARARHPTIISRERNMHMTDRERAIRAIRRGVPLGDVVLCSCHSTPPTRKGCFGVCEDSVAAIIASYEDIRRKAERPSTESMHDLICAIIQDEASYDPATNTWDTSKAATAIIAAFDGESTVTNGAG